ncbi:hypothetical protein GY45DRAFT_1330610 [Cubamyces sp. BRFM 1775]|nr:hypothetical protein GY45DRAFT_1330610 [Cubamyces sp. BRFM 1775]
MSLKRRFSTRSKISTKSITFANPLLSAKAVPDDRPFLDASRSDLTIRTSDGEEFHVYKCIVANASPVFSDMFSLPPSPNQADNSSISVPEDSTTWERLLRICYVLPHDPNLSLDEIRTTLEAGRKYEMGPVTACMRSILLQPSYTRKQALRTYAIACAQGLQDVALVAARGCLALPDNLGSAKELELISALQYTRLLDFRKLCGVAAARALGGTAWLVPYADVLGPCSTCEGGRWECSENLVIIHGRLKTQVLCRIRPAWIVYCTALSKRLQEQPGASLAQSPELLGPVIASAYGCRKCRLHIFGQVIRFAAVVADRIERAIDEVPLEI